jgi:hypothetical protein
MGNQKNTGKGLHAHWSILREYRRLIIPLWNSGRVTLAGIVLKQAELDTDYNPPALQQLLKSERISRIREKYGPRLVDIDIFFITWSIVINIKVPHPEIQNRRFVCSAHRNYLVIHPVLKKSMAELLRMSDPGYQKSKYKLIFGLIHNILLPQSLTPSFHLLCVFQCVVEHQTWTTTLLR